MIHTEELSCQIGAFRLDRVSIQIPANKYFVLLGPPGAGKSIFLECLCGLRTVDSGRIFLGQEDVTQTEPRLRGIGYVPQDYALFSHLTARDNVSFGLRVRRFPARQMTSRVQEVAQLLRIEHLLPRGIAGLSGGERQRLALARALVLEPPVLLLDEPVCALDEATRQEICAQLLRVQRQMQLTVVHVSHNLEEAFSVADHAAILHEGRLQQAGAMDELVRKPNSEFVARFVRAENILSGRVCTPPTEAPWTRVELSHAVLDVLGRHRGDIQFTIRPDQVLVLREGEHARHLQNHLELQLARWRDCGAYVRLELTGSIDLVAHITPAAFSEIRHCPRLTVVLPLQSIHVLS